MQLKSKIPRLLYGPSFRRYWTGQTISLFGNQITNLALPLTAVLVLHASSTTMGILKAAVWIPYLLIGIHAGAWIDQYGKRRQIMILSDIVRAILLISIPISYLLGYLNLTVLLLVAFLTGIFTVIFNVSSNTLFVSIVPKEGYVEANSLLNGSRAFSYQVGPSLGGLLIQLISAPITLVADGVSFLTSAVLLSKIHVDEPPPVKRKPGHIIAGLHYLWSTPILRFTLACVATINFFSFVFSALFLLYVTRSLHVAPGVLCLIMAIGAIGAVFGSTVATKISNVIGLGFMLLLGTILLPLPLILVPLAGGPHFIILLFLFLAEFLSGFGGILLDISYGAVKTAVIPDDIRARVNGAWGFINNGIRPIGALVGGILPVFLGIHGSIWIGAIGACLGSLWLIPMHITKMRDLRDFVPQKLKSDSGS